MQILPPHLVEILGRRKPYRKSTLRTSGEDVKTTLKTSGEDEKNTLKTSEEDGDDSDYESDVEEKSSTRGTGKTTLVSSGEDVKLHSFRV
jgi:hypothetical protein